jgi:hypothetical protein
VGADHGSKAELARHDRGVAQRSTFFHDEGADHGQRRVHRRCGERRDQGIARLELIERQHPVAHHARPPAVRGVADADPAHDGWFAVCGRRRDVAARLAMSAAVARATGRCITAVSTVAGELPVSGPAASLALIPTLRSERADRRLRTRSPP